MFDIYTDDLLTVLEEALRPPAHLSASELAAWHSHTLRNRLPLIREALRLAREEGDGELATGLVDQAIAHHPDPPRAARRIGGDGASLPVPSQANPPAEEELPIPEHVLCTLLYKHWCMTIVGTPPEETFMAFRPFGWVGEGDPSERITASSRHQLLHRLFRRHLVNGNPDDVTQAPTN
ncbi:hypothetical protein NE857_04175 [Nocardiopsis exhalans]|uniref:Uncharacterized protein n=1 Tax=Nocardiopsis exhalans TaxID=163604 RepID=A0ABY5DCC1_9ACTN|nr:hypothetical protein [Nocardiopsis exhalans]USY20858.1 hypothetical protein NE857_04175 [Nocardiopsis exhalans]